MLLSLQLSKGSANDVPRSRGLLYRPFPGKADTGRDSTATSAGFPFSATAAWVSSFPPEKSMNRVRQLWDRILFLFYIFSK